MTDIAPPDVGMNFYQKSFEYNGRSFAHHIDSIQWALQDVNCALHNHENNLVPVSYEQVAKDLGIVLQGISAISAKMGIPLSDLARANIYQYEQTKIETEDNDDQH